MIEKMKKLTFLVTNQEYDQFINGLREQGVVHVQQLRQGATSPELQQAIDLQQRYQQNISYLDFAQGSWGKTLQPMEQGSKSKMENPLDILTRIEQLQDEEVAIRHEIDEAEKNVGRMEPWGDFNWEDIRKIEQATGLKVHFFSCPSKMYRKEWAETCFATPVDEIQKRIYFLTFSEQCPDITAERMELPEGKLSQYRSDLETAREKSSICHAELCYMQQNYMDLLKEALRKVQSDIQLHEVQLSDETIADGAVRLMVGWTLAEKTESLTQWLDDNRIFYELEDPSIEDEVPVQLRNNGFSRLFEPILKMYSLPSYNDIDPSNFFAPFFMLFFGLCMGDGGYGLLILSVGIYLAVCGKGEIKNYGRLACWLGGMTVICGFATGTVFGINLTEQDWAFLAPVKKYFLSDSGCGPIFGYSPMMVISVIIGFIQVLIGMVLKACKAWKNYGFGYAIGTFSWVVVLLAAIGTLAVPAGSALMYLLYALMGISVLGIFLYNNPSAYKNPIVGPLMNIGAGLWNTYGMATGLLGDLLSYIRLFALGLTGGILGFVFNSLALDLTKEMPWTIRWIPLTLLLLFGHGLTFALSMISAFVHPMRLTFVEFFKNADFSGGGKAYVPFKK